MQKIRPGLAVRLSTVVTAMALTVTALTVSTQAGVAPAGSVAPFAQGDLTDRSDETGKVGFIGSTVGSPIETGATRASSPTVVAKEFLRARGRQLGLDARTTGLLVADQRPLPGGGTLVRLGQTFGGVPVLGGEFTVSLDAGRDVLSVLGEASPIVSASTEPTVTAAAARDAAVQRIARETRTPEARLTSSRPELMFYDPRLLDAPGPFQSARLSWVLEVRGVGPVSDLQHLVVVDATSGTVPLSFSTIAHAKNRTVCDANNTETQYPCLAPLRTEANPPTGVDDTDVQRAFEYAGDTYDFFLGLGHDSLDDNGMTLVSTTDWCPLTDCPAYQNAFWSGEQMVYGDGFASADDVVGHELAHGFTDFSSSLFYYQQSGAINEALSDIFGELIDLTNGAGTDTAPVRWQVGEDVPGFGAIRDMEHPPTFGDPDRMLSPNYTADPTEQDSGGVHSNSGVANKAAYLIADGGTFNSQTVTGLGIPKAARLFYTVNTSFLVSGSDYADLANALRQGCRNLVSSGTDGFTAADCAEVDKAVLAVEMDQNPTAAPTTTATVCPSGTSVITTILADDLEIDTNQVIPMPIVGPNAWYYPQNPNPFFDATYATSGSTNIYGDNSDLISDSALQMANSVTIPAGAYLHFNHAYGFEDDSSGAYDGGVVEYSTSGPLGTWVDAGPLFDAAGGDGGYTGSIFVGAGNPLAGRGAFVRDSFGYGASRADLSSLAGQSVMFRWRIGTDSSVYDYGWFLDDLRIGTCGIPVEPTPPPTPTGPDPAGPAPTGPAPLPPVVTPTTAPDTTPPQTSIKKAPRKRTTKRTASFSFVAGEPGMRFRCKLDRGSWRSCTSPKKFKVKVGKHVFQVAAVDAAGNLDLTPAKHRWSVRR